MLFSHQRLILFSSFSLMLCLLFALIIWALPTGPTPTAILLPALSLISIFFIYKTAYYGRQVLRHPHHPSQKTAIRKKYAQQVQTMLDNLASYSSHSIRRSYFHLILGQEHVGKSALLQSANMEPLAISTPKSNTPLALQCWQANPQHIFWEANLNTSTDCAPESLGHCWQDLLYTLHSYGLRTLMRNLFIVIPVQLLHPNKDMELTTYLAELSTSLKQLQSSRLKMQATVLITQCDNICGFASFFKCLNAEQRAQPWGISLSHVPYSPDCEIAFEPLYNDMITSLQNQLLTKIQQTTEMDEKRQINDFTLQIKKLTTPLAQILHQLSFSKRLPLQGIYLTSSMTGDTQHDLLTTTDAEHTDQTLASQTYFMETLFQSCQNTPLSLHPRTCLPWIYQQICRSLPLLRKILNKYTLTCAAILCTLLFVTLQNIQHYRFLHTTLLRHILPQSHYSVSLHQFSTLWPNQPSTDNHPLNTRFRISKLVKRRTVSQYQRLFHQRFLPQLQQDMLHSIPQELQVSLQTAFPFYTLYLTLNQPQARFQSLLTQWFVNQWTPQEPSTYSLNATEKRNYITSLIQTWPMREKATHPLPPIIETIRTHLSALSQSQQAVMLANMLYIDDLSMKKPNQSLSNENIWTQNQPDSIRLIQSHYLMEACKTYHNYQYLFPASSQPQLTTHQCIESSNQAYLNDLAKYHLTQLYQQQNPSFHTLQDATTFLSQTVSPAQLDQYKTLESYLTAENIDPNLQRGLSELVKQLGQHIQVVKNPQVQSALGGLHVLFNNMTAHETPNQVAFETTLAHLQAQQAEHDPIEQLFIQANVNSSPWLQHIATQARACLMTASGEYINQIWHDTLYPFYSQRISNHYPIAHDQTTELKISDLKEFFGPNGLLQTFFSYYISPFVQQDKEAWHWRTLNKQKLDLDDVTLSLFFQAALVEKMYFHHSDSPHFEFSLMPTQLHSSLRKFVLNIGGQRIDYDGSEQKPMNFSWPPRDTGVSAQFYDASNRIKAITHNSPWAWFHLIDLANLQIHDNPQLFTLTFELDGAGVRFEMISDSMLNPYIPGVIESFSNMPDHLKTAHSHL